MAVAITLGAGGVSLTQAAVNDGPKPVVVALDAPCRIADTRVTSNVGPKDTVLAAVGIGTGGKVTIFDNEGTTHAAVDILG